MIDSEASCVRVERDRFLQQVVIHHRAGDHYPDPRVLGDELHFTQMQIDAVLRELRALGWIAASPYDPERLRLTPRCWNLLRRIADRATDHDCPASDDHHNEICLDAWQCPLPADALT